MTGQERPKPRDRVEAAFERDLDRAARSLVGEPLEPRVLEIARRTPAPASRRLDPALSLAAVAVAIALVFVVGPRLLPAGPGGASGLRSTAVVSTELRGAGWSCSPVSGASASSVARTAAASQAPTVRLVCQAPPTAHPLVAAMIFGEDPRGALTGVEIKSDILGTSNGTLVARQIDFLYQFIALPFANSADAALARSWLRANLPLATGGPAQAAVGGIPVRISILPGGGYVIVIGEVPVSD
jgi:hypothetical protein